MEDNRPPVGSLNSKRGSDSGSSNDKKPREKKQALVNNASIAKKTLAEKYKETFVKQDIASVGEDLLKDKIFPGIISMIRDTIWDAITMHFGLGGSRGSSGNNGGRTGYTNYQAASTSSYNYTGGRTGGNGGSSGSSSSVKQSGPQDFRDICYISESDAEEVLVTMRRYAKQYEGYATVSDLYEYSGLTTNQFTDNNWGWNVAMMEGVKIYRKMVGGDLRYFIDLPNPIPVS